MRLGTIDVEELPLINYYSTIPLLYGAPGQYPRRVHLHDKFATPHLFLVLVILLIPCFSRPEVTYHPLRRLMSGSIQQSAQPWTHQRVSVSERENFRTTTWAPPYISGKLPIRGDYCEVRDPRWDKKRHPSSIVTACCNSCYWGHTTKLQMRALQRPCTQILLQQSCSG